MPKAIVADDFLDQLGPPSRVESSGHKHEFVASISNKAQPAQQQLHSAHIPPELPSSFQPHQKSQLRGTMMHPMVYRETPSDGRASYFEGTSAAQAYWNGCTQVAPPPPAFAEEQQQMMHFRQNHGQGGHHCFTQLMPAVPGGCYGQGGLQMTGGISVFSTSTSAPSYLNGGSGPPSGFPSHPKRKTMSSETLEEKEAVTRDRNREHAKNTRLRKKAYVNNLSQLITSLMVIL